jgi:predicted nucleic acid-binding protein
LAAELIGLDTTVLLAHEIREAAGHGSVRAHIREASRAGRETYALAPQVLQEFLHVATDARRFQHPLSFEEALRRSRAWWEAAEILHCHPGDRAWDQAWSWMAEFRLGRKRILDTYLAATYQERGIARLATANPDDFNLFGTFHFEPWALASPS